MPSFGTSARSCETNKTTSYQHVCTSAYITPLQDCCLAFCIDRARRSSARQLLDAQAYGQMRGGNTTPLHNINHEPHLVELVTPVVDPPEGVAGFWRRFCGQNRAYMGSSQGEEEAHRANTYPLRVGMSFVIILNPKP